MVNVVKRTTIALALIAGLSSNAYAQRIEALTPLSLDAPPLNIFTPVAKLWAVRAAGAALGDGQMECYETQLNESLRSFVSGKSACLGGNAPLAELENVRLLDRFNIYYNRADLLYQRPMQSRAGMIMTLDEKVDMGIAYRFTRISRDDPARQNQLMPFYQEVEGHVALARLRVFLP
ncbi:MAG: hypothetical protein PVF65_10770 [Sphingomonadales bacterium]|jgi:hypothetical protein